MLSQSAVASSIRRTARGVDWGHPFSRLAVAHFASVAGDAVVAIALAGSLFFAADPSAGRERVFLYLLITMAPFALVGPLIGPAMDRMRGGHRNVVVATSFVRAVCAVAMIGPVRSDDLLLYPEALVMLVCAKSYQVAKAALVPSTVATDDQLVEANSKLQLLSAIAGVVVGAPAGLLLLIGPDWVIGFAALVFAGAGVSALRMAPRVVAADAPDAEERAELRSAGVVLAATAMAILRGIVGFVSFLMAFSLRGGAAPGPTGTLTGEIAGRRGSAYLFGTVGGELSGPPPAWYFGAVIGLSVAGGTLGAAVAPRLRQRVTEERILLGSLVLAAVSGIAGIVFGGVMAYAGFSFGVALASSAGKQAFDAVVQRDAPDANRGRSFALFESRFQMAWVIGALPPVVIAMPVAFGGAFVTAIAAFGAVGYFVGRFPSLRRSALATRRVDPIDHARRLLAARPPFASRAAVDVDTGGVDEPDEDRSPPSAHPPVGTDEVGPHGTTVQPAKPRVVGRYGRATPPATRSRRPPPLPPR